MRHVNEAHGGRMLCPHCMAGFANFDALRNHGASTHLVTLNACRKCKMLFASKEELKVRPKK